MDEVCGIRGVGVSFDGRCVFEWRLRGIFGDDPAGSVFGSS